MRSSASDSDELLLMEEPRVRRTVNRMAHQIAEENKGESDILLVGLKQRGYIVAEMLGSKLQMLTERTVSVQQMQIPEKTALRFEAPDDAFSYIVLIDDVIFSGRTMFAALQALSDKMQPQKVRTAVLVDRGHRSFPVQASFVGLNLPTKLKEHVQVMVQSHGVNKVVLNNRTN